MLTIEAHPKPPLEAHTRDSFIVHYTTENLSASLRAQKGYHVCRLPGVLYPDFIATTRSELYCVCEDPQGAAAGIGIFSRTDQLTHLTGRGTGKTSASTGS